MKTVAVQISAFLRDPAARSNVRLMGKLLLLSVLIVVVYTFLFHLIMAWEGQRHSVMTGLYWTLVTMSTLGFGDIVFHTDVGRLFSVVVLMTGISLFLVVLPFAFIQFLYAPWLEARLKYRSPRELPAGTSGHIVICDWDPVGEALVQRLQRRNESYVVIEPDPVRATELLRDDIHVVAGEPDDVNFLRGIHVAQARMVFANRLDEVNTNIALTIREVSKDVPILCVATRNEAEDVLELSGASEVLPLKRWLGEQLANRVGAGHAQANVVGKYRDLLLAELPVRNTPLVGKTVRDTKLRAATGASVIGVWTRGHMGTATPETELTEASVAVVVGTQEQIENLDDLLIIYDVNPSPVVVVGAGRVGRAAIDALVSRGIAVNAVDIDAVHCDKVQEGVQTFVGDASDLKLLTRAGINEAPAVVLTTHDDAMNIFLASYCRRLKPEIRVVCRVTHERNVEAVHRAGADFALSYTSLGVAAVLAHIDERELFVLGGELDLFTAPVPRSLAGKALKDSDIGKRTGALVLAIEDSKSVITNPPGEALLPKGGEILLLGDQNQRAAFTREFGGKR
ncbi:NAD-binding protein [soil metagenome]